MTASLHISGHARTEKNILDDERATAAKQLGGIDNVTTETFLCRCREAKEFPIPDYKISQSLVNTEIDRERERMQHDAN